MTKGQTAWTTELGNAVDTFSVHANLHRVLLEPPVYYVNFSRPSRRVYIDHQASTVLRLDDEDIPHLPPVHVTASNLHKIQCTQRCLSMSTSISSNILEHTLHTLVSLLQQLLTQAIKSQHFLNRDKRHSHTVPLTTPQQLFHYLNWVIPEFEFSRWSKQMVTITLTHRTDYNTHTTTHRITIC